jgi:hypothetical protein
MSRLTDDEYWERYDALSPPLSHPAREYETVYCGDCAGSGEGLHEGATCATCGGSGEVSVEVDPLRVEPSVMLPFPSMTRVRQPELQRRVASLLRRKV